MSFFNHRIPSSSSSSSFDKAILDDYQTKTDSNLTTSDKTIVGAINNTSTQINDTNNQINSINTQISNINTQINSTISEADINTIINNALK